MLAIGDENVTWEDHDKRLAKLGECGLLTIGTIHAAELIPSASICNAKIGSSTGGRVALPKGSG